MLNYQLEEMRSLELCSEGRINKRKQRRETNKLQKKSFLFYLFQPQQDFHFEKENRK